MNGRNFERNALVIIKIIMFPIMLILYTMYNMDNGDDNFCWSIFWNKMKASMKQYWS